MNDTRLLYALGLAAIVAFVGLYRGVESGITVSLKAPGMDAMPMEAVKLAALKHAPMLAAKVYTDLAVGDVMAPSEAQARISKAREFYEAAYQRVLHGDLAVGGSDVRAVERAEAPATPGDDSGA